MLDSIKSLFFDVTSLFSLTSIIDILIMTFIIYKVIKYLESSLAMNVIRGIVIILIVMQLSEWLGLIALSYVIKNLMTVGVIALVIIFQPEIRRAFYKIGGSRFDSIFSKFIPNKEDQTNVSTFVNEMSKAVEYLSQRKIGMLVVVERDSKLDDIQATGTKLDSILSFGLLVNIFIPNTPLHDGAVIVSTPDYMVKAASCVLPLSQSTKISQSLGTRHRAAIGISEVSDCISIVVSEETGRISIATDGKITRFDNVDEFRNSLFDLLAIKNRKKEDKDE